MDEGALPPKASGVTQFLRHFSPRSQPPQTPSSRFRSIKKNRKPQPDFQSPVSVAAPWKQPISAATTAEEESVSFESERIGISPTRYDIPNNYAGAPLPSSLQGPAEREVVFFDDAPQLPNLFTSLAQWEVSREEEFGMSEQFGSPQKSIGSCGSGSDCSNTNSIRSATSRLFRGNKFPSGATQAKRNARQIVLRAREKENSGGRGNLFSSAQSDSSAGTATDAPPSTVQIFLLLLEPNTKAFELIQLVYPRKNTRVGDLLKMIPKNATEPALASQAYIGITRPKRRAEPVTDLKRLASNSIFNAQGTAGIGQGEIILAIPSHSSASQIVGLSKQILASSQIQKLIAKSNGGNNSAAASRRNKKHRGRKTDSVATSSSAAPIVLAEPFVAMSNTAQDIDKSDIGCEAASIGSDSANLFGKTEMKRAVDEASVANERAGRSPCVSPALFLSENLIVGSAKKEKTVEFPSDMLDAYLSKDAVQKICTGGRSIDSSLPFTDADDMSCDGSLTSSFHSWSQSLDDSVTRMTNKAVSLAEAASSPRTRTKRFAKHMALLRRCATAVVILTVARYNLDPNGLAAPAARADIILQPMGWMGFVQVFVSFIALVKTQRYLGLPFVRTRQSRCPAMRAAARMGGRQSPITDSTNGITFS